MTFVTKTRKQAAPRSTISLLTGSANSDWRTPAWLAAVLKRDYGPFDLDPAAAPGTSLGRRSFDRHDGGRAQPWRGRVYCNPPHARALGETVGPWMEKAIEELDQGNCRVVVMLVPARTDTVWWHDQVMACAETVIFIRGRLKFRGASDTSPAPFPSAVVIFTRARPRGGPTFLALSERDAAAAAAGKKGS